MLHKLEATFQKIPIGLIVLNMIIVIRPISSLRILNVIPRKKIKIPKDSRISVDLNINYPTIGGTHIRLSPCMVGFQLSFGEKGKKLNH